MSAFENRDYADGYRDGTRFAEVTITALRAEVERLRGEATGIALEAQKVCLQNIQMKFALGYPMDANLEKYVLPENPFKCGTCAASRAENEKLRAALWDARECVQAWSGYASEYFREKNDLAGDLARIDAALEEKQ